MPSCLAPLPRKRPCSQRFVRNTRTAGRPRRRLLPAFSRNCSRRSTRTKAKHIESREVLGLNEVAPHVELTVDLATQKAGQRTEDYLAGRRYSQHRRCPRARKCSNCRACGSRSRRAPSAPPVRNFDATAKSLLTQFDKDGNGYLEKSELPPLPGQFEMFDEDGDGKAYPAEIAAGYARQAAPQLTQVVANVVQQSNSLFQTLDTSGDGRLGLREMRAAAERLAALDKDQDQTIGGTEIPEAISVSFAWAAVRGPFVERPVGPPADEWPAREQAGPEWFTRMDRNGDGDVTLKEFLGSEADFQRLDTSGDGLLDAQEAKAAGR